jgi:hypothetical protein
VVADVEARPFGLIDRVRLLDRLRDFAGADFHPSAREGECQLLHQAVALGGELVEGVLVALRRRGLDSEDEPRHPVIGLLAGDAGREFLRALEPPLRRLHEQRLLHERQIARITLEGRPIVLGCGRHVVLPAGDAPGQIAAEQGLATGFAIARSGVSHVWRRWSAEHRSGDYRDEPAPQPRDSLEHRFTSRAHDRNPAGLIHLSPS